MESRRHLQNAIFDLPVVHLYQQYSSSSNCEQGYFTMAFEGVQHNMTVIIEMLNGTTIVKIVPHPLIVLRV